MGNTAREKTLAINTSILLIGTLLPRLTGIITLPILTAALDKAEYGTYELILTLISFFLPIVTLRIDAAAFRFLIEARGNQEACKNVITNTLFFVLGISLFSLTILYFSLYKFAPAIRLLTCVYLLADTLCNTLQQITRGLSKTKIYSISTVSKTLINMLIVVLLFHHDRLGLIGVLLAAIISTGAAGLILFFSSKLFAYFDVKALNFGAIKPYLKYSWPMVPNSLAIWILNASDRFVLNFAYGVEAVAVYAVANKIPSLFSIVQNTFTMAWQENASLASCDSDAEWYYSKVFDDVFRLAAGCMALLIAFTPLAFRVLIRGEYGSAYLHIPILSLAILFSTISSFLGGIYIGHMQTSSVGISTLIAAAINLTIDICFVRTLGIFAASISTLVSFAVLVAFRMRDIQRFQKMHYNVGFICICIGLLTVMGFLEAPNLLAANLFNIAFSIAFCLIINKKMIKRITDALKNHCFRR